MKFDEKRYVELLDRWAGENGGHLETNTEEGHWFVVNDETGEPMVVPDRELAGFLYRSGMRPR